MAYLPRALKFNLLCKVAFLLFGTILSRITHHKWPQNLQEIQATEVETALQVIVTVISQITGDIFHEATTSVVLLKLLLSMKLLLPLQLLLFFRLP